jgi:hypothetical protein
MSAVFSLNRVRMTVNKETLEKIADLLNIPEAHRKRILTNGLVISAPAPSSSPKSASRTSTPKQK